MSALTSHLHRPRAAATAVSATERMGRAETLLARDTLLSYITVLTTAGVWILAQAITLTGAAEGRPAGRWAALLTASLPSLFPAILLAATAVAVIRVIQLVAAVRTARAERGGDR